MRKQTLYPLILVLLGITLLIMAACASAATPTEVATEEPPVETEEPAMTEETPQETEEPMVEVSGDVVHGGLLYDKWWKVSEGAEEPTGDQALWATQTTNERSGADTWRCKECHGWDYLGPDGAYGSGSHFTGFPGLFGLGMSAEELVAALTGGTNPDHDFSALLGEQDINDLAVFLAEGLIDAREYIDYETKQAKGDVSSGEGLYADTCQACHGEDGWQILFDDGEAGVGTLAVDNPWEILHKIRFGHPGSPMPSSVASGWSDQDAVDVLTYAQTLPVEPPVSEAAVRGGLLYDKWWSVVEGAEEPTGDQPLWATQTTNERSGADTWRCKECHGWDYLGPDGAYGSGSHFTGFPGLFGIELTSDELLAALTGGVNPDHDFSALLGEDDLAALVAFLSETLIDAHEYIDYDSKEALGDADNGGVLYNDTCAACHGEDGATLNFGSDDEPEFVGNLARDNPWEVLHKIRFGHPGSPMPSSIALGWSIQDAVDVLTYVQQALNLD